MTIARNEATQAQVLAADPHVSTWLSANAGSGKTRVLTDRVARLLLGGVDPQHILCLTYTKAAASEMQNRLFKRLGEWAMLADTKLQAALQELGEDGPMSARDLAKARTLFAQAVETPGGLKIQTIHAFCAGLLRRFPLEAGVPPQFQEIEDRAAELLRQEIVETIAAGPEAPLLQALARFSSGDDLGKLTREIVANKTALAEPRSWQDIAASFGLDPDQTQDDLLRKVLIPEDSDICARIIPLMQASNQTNQTAAGKLAKIQTSDHSAVVGLASALLTQAGTRLKTLPAASIVKTAPELAEKFIDLQHRLETFAQTRRDLFAAEKTYALTQFAPALIRLYSEEKRIRGWLDFDDLIERTRQLLSDDRVANWVLYRLDGGISHILVDEAQDTSLAQWDVIGKLTQELTAGRGAGEDRDRSLFVVGDKKQSIYSFQGADPQAFDDMHDHFGNHLGAIGAAFASRSLGFSFRSSSAILDLVDTVFKSESAAGFSPGQDHRAFNTEMPGRVDLWPAVEPVKDKDERDWWDPVDRLPPTHHRFALAHQVADAIALMLDKNNPATIPDRDENGAPCMRAVRPGDIKILVQSRDALFHEIIRACKQRELPIAGADLLRVGAELAVRDLLAVLAVLSTPEDDLSLATVLRSPLFGWAEQQLYDIAQGRGSKTLWQVLRDDTANHSMQATSMLRDLRNKAGFLRPYELIERILTNHDGRRRLLSRLGPKAEDGIDALLSQALAYEASAVPSLTGFLEWAKADDLEIKRQVDSSGDLIRVMTVHGAKGLEAPVVILPDCAKRRPPPSPDLLQHSDALIWKTNKKDMPEAVLASVQARDDAQHRERLRLLYVAMTRAQSWLIVAAAGNLDKSGDDWYGRILRGMTDLDASHHDFASGQGLRLEIGDWSRAPRSEPEPIAPETPVLEPFYHLSAPPPAVENNPRAPSDLGGAKALASDKGLDERTAKLRGTYIHLLLERLGGHDPAEWSARTAACPTPEGLTDAQIDEARSIATATLATPALSWIFAPAGLSEVTLAAPHDGSNLLGTVDRLLVDTDRVTVIDFKSNMAVPEAPEDCPEGVLRQMGAYAAMLAQIYPGRTIKSGILWTTSQSYMELPQNLVNEALARAPRLDDVRAAT